ncbi:sigma-70 family RNA polymerase sigma factor [Pseudorhodoferax sp.]|uniref:sigma-70 family RNA polymerase sigma factor n=1 Tax=Pseudorhodoferax sp. TaxID=1993553 RepID=UPI002DD658A1|nr:sigma-70 family RNA polymerase sigma factor [Pseudorhodoferax sp.]
MLPPIDDNHARRLLQRCTERDERALVELHRLLARRIHAFVWQRLRDDELAQAAVIDTLHEVWKSAARFRGESRVSTWVLGIARFKAMELRRQSEPPGEGFDDIEDHAETLAADTEDGAETLARWQQAEQVRLCLKQLGAAQRECMQLVYYEGLGLADVARVQQVPEGTVKTRLFHARRLMRACVEGLAGRARPTRTEPDKREGSDD